MVNVLNIILENADSHLRTNWLRGENFSAALDAELSKSLSIRELIKLRISFAELVGL